MFKRWMMFYTSLAEKKDWIGNSYARQTCIQRINNCSYRIAAFVLYINDTFKMILTMTAKELNDIPRYNKKLTLNLIYNLKENIKTGY